MNRARSAIVGVVGVGLVLLFQGCSSQAPPDESLLQDATTELRQARAYGGVVHEEAGCDARADADASSCREVVLVATKEEDGQATVSPPMTFAIPASATDEQGNTSEVIFTFSNSTVSGSTVSCTYHRSGKSYDLTGCSNGADAGALETADTFDLHFTNANDSSTNPGDKHRVSLTIDEAPPCGAKDAGPDAPPDVAPDAPKDVTPEVRPDAPADVVVEPPVDAPTDVVVDSPVDAGADVPTDVVADVPTCNASNCTPNNSCDVATCSGSTCTHTNATNGTSCTGTNLCNHTYTCQSGVCTGSNPVVCTASDACHVAGTCSPSTGTCSNPAAPDGTACSDGNACTQTDSCQSGVCTGSNPVICTASDQCHAAGTCSPSTGVCSNPAQPNGTTCGDGNACTQTDTCQGGLCTGSNPVLCTASDQCHAPGTCSPSTGLCSNPSAPDGTVCNDGNACTLADMCTAGTCVGTSPVVCTALDQCHLAGSCNPGTGACSNPSEPDGTGCNDGSACTQTDACLAGVCTGTNPIVCTASDQCHAIGTCDPASGVCSNPAALNGIPCNDGNLCDLVAACQSGTCTAVASVICTPLDSCHTAGTCNPATGSCSNPAIPGCDSNPIQQNVFEPNASFMGKVVDTSGNPFTGYTIQVFDAPATGSPRSDVALTVAPDGSFRARLTTFPTSEPRGTAPHHEILQIQGAGILPAVRDAFLHVGDADDLGPIMVQARDSNVTVIGASGGTATDSHGLVEVDIPAGALTSPISVTITPILQRAAIPYPLPDVTATTYAYELEPSGTQFAVPVTVRVANTLSLPTNEAIPVGYLDRTRAIWLHAGESTWDGTRFAFTTTHFSGYDNNKGVRPNPIPPAGPGGPDGDGGCPPVGSTVNWSNGSLRETASLPTYQALGHAYGVTLAYDSALTVGSSSTSVPATSYAAVPHTTLTAKDRGLRFQMSQPARPASDGVGANSPTSCNAVACVGTNCTFFSGSYTLRVDALGSSQSLSLVVPPGAKDILLNAPLEIPLTDASDIPTSRFERQTLTFIPAGGSACVGGAGTFGSTVSGPAQQTTQDAGPLFTLERHVFVHHRHASPFGEGWALKDIGRIFRDPSGDGAVLAGGDGNDELFIPRTSTTTYSGGSGGFVARTIARDSTTGQTFLISITNSEIDLINADGTLTPTLTGLGFETAPLNAAVTYVGGVRHFLVALSSRLLDIDAGGSVRTLASRTPVTNDNSATMFSLPGIAGFNGFALYVDGGSTPATLVRFHLTDTTPAAVALSMPTGGDIGLDPQTPLSGVTFGDPHGLAFAPDGSLYVADRLRNVVYQIEPDASSQISGSSAVLRALGDGAGRYVSPLGYRLPGPRFPLNQPDVLAIGDDGSLWIASPFGLAAYDPSAREARWLVEDASIAGSELLFGIGPSLGLAVLSPTSVLAYDSETLFRIDLVLSSEFDPTRTVLFDSSGIGTLIDTTTNIVEAYDGAGRLAQQNKRTGEPVFAVTYADTTSDQVSAISDPTGGMTAFAYGGGHLQSITDAAGRVTQVAINGSGDLTSLILPDGETTTFAYTAHRVTQKTTPNGDVTTYTYASDGSLASATKPAGEVTQVTAASTQPLTRDSNGYQVRGGNYVDTHGVTHTFTLDYHGNITTDTYTASGVSYAVSQVPATTLVVATGSDNYTNRRNTTLGRIAYSQNNGLYLGTQNIFDVQGRLVGTNTGGSSPPISSNTYDANGFLSGYFQGPANDTFKITRDAVGHPTKIAEVGFFGSPTGREIDYTWNAQGLPATRTEHGITTTYTYDAKGNVLSTVDTLGRTTAMTYDAAGNVTSSNDGQTTTTFTHDAANRVVTSTDALGNTTTYGYALPSCGCSQGDLVTSIHTPDLPAGVAWTMLYGPEGRLASVTDPDGITETYTYQSTGELIQLLDRDGHATAMGYDQLGRVTSIIDALSRAHGRTYPVPTATGWTGPSLLAGSASSTSATTSLTGTLNPGDYQIGTNGFDSPFVGIGFSVISRNEPQVSLYQDATFQLSYGLQWDLGPRLVDKEDRNGLPISSPVAFGTVGQTGADFHEQTSYDVSLATPLLQSQASTDPVNNEQSTFSYNTDHDLTATSGFEPPDPYANYTYVRDTGGRLTSVTRRFTNGIMTGPPFGNVTGPASTYAYFPNGYLQQRKDADGEHDYVYDSRGLLETITIPGEGVYTFGYDQLGRNTQLTFPDGHVRMQQYDQEGRITSRCYEYTGSSPTRCYLASYDPVGNPVTMTDPEGTDTLTYDALNRLVQVSRSTGGIEDYAFNTLGALSTNAGAVLNMQRPLLVGAGTADSAVPSVFNSLPVTLDPGGRITSFNGDTFVYDKRNQLHSVTEGGSTEFYGLDSFMRRIARYTSSTVNEFYVYEGDENITEPQLALAAGQVLSSTPVSTAIRNASTLTIADQLAPQNIAAMLDASGGVVKSWLYDGVDRPLRVNLSGTIMYYEIDLAGNVRRLRSPLGDDLGGYRYTAFGEAYPADAGTPAPLIDQPLQWKARWFSPLAGGSYDIRARQWSPGLGAFLQVDGFEFAEPSLRGPWQSLWSWTNQNPTRFLDHTGHGVSDCLQGCWKSFPVNWARWGYLWAKLAYKACCLWCYSDNQQCPEPGACDLVSP